MYRSRSEGVPLAAAGTVRFGTIRCGTVRYGAPVSVFSLLDTTATMSPSLCVAVVLFCFAFVQESLEAVRSVEAGVRPVVVHAGRLFGAAGGEEPVPFLTGPKAEPVLDESITRQAVLVGPGTVLSSVRGWVDGYRHDVPSSSTALLKQTHVRCTATLLKSVLCIFLLLWY